MSWAWGFPLAIGATGAALLCWLTSAVQREVRRLQLARAELQSARPRGPLSPPRGRSTGA